MNEMEIWKEYRSTYEEQFPMPEKTVARLMSTIGWQFIMVATQSIGAITLASMRTAEMFFLAAAGSAPFLKYGEAIAAVITVEVGIVVFAAIKAEQENAKKTEEEQRTSIGVAVKQLLFAEVICLLISMAAGLGVSFRGFGIDVPQFKMVLSVLLGAGASIIAAVSGSIMGVMLARFGNIRDGMVRQYKIDLATWKDGLTSSWEKSPEREIARNDITTKQIKAQADIEAVQLGAMASTDLQLARAKEELANLKVSMREGRGVRSNVRSLTRSLPRSFPQNENENTDAVNPVAQRIFDYLDEYMAQNPSQQVPGPSRMARDLGIAKSYASTQTNIWKLAHPEFPTSEIDVTDLGLNVTQELDALTK